MFLSVLMLAQLTQTSWTDQHAPPDVKCTMRNTPLIPALCVALHSLSLCGG